MKINFNEMMAEGREDAALPDQNTKNNPDCNRYFFVDKKTGLRVSYSDRPYSMTITGLSDKCDSKTLYRAVVRRFLETFPSSRPHARLSALVWFINNQLQYSKVMAPLTDTYRSLEFSAKPFSTRFAKLFGDRYSKPKVSSTPFGFNHFKGEQHWVSRNDRFTQRDRDYRRLAKSSPSPGAISLSAKLNYAVQSYNNNCATVWKTGPKGLSVVYAGWVYSFSKQQIECFDDKNNVIRTIPISLSIAKQDDFIPLFGVRNCFSAFIHQQVGDTVCLRLLNKNLSTYGYVCVDTLRNDPNFELVRAGNSNNWSFARSTKELLISSTPAKAFAQMLAAS